MAKKPTGAAASWAVPAAGCEEQPAGAAPPPESDLADPLVARSALSLLEALRLYAERPQLARLVRRAAALDDRRLALVERFTEQVIEAHDPDAVETFLGWKGDPVIDTILLLAAGLDEDARYEVLELAEDLRRAAA